MFYVCFQRYREHVAVKKALKENHFVGLKSVLRTIDTDNNNDSKFQHLLKDKLQILSASALSQEILFLQFILCERGDKNASTQNETQHRSTSINHRAIEKDQSHYFGVISELFVRVQIPVENLWRGHGEDKNITRLLTFLL